MFGDGWPEDEDTFRQDQLDAIAATLAHDADASDTAVSSYEARCGTHRSVDQQREVGVGLTAHTASVMGWN